MPALLGDDCVVRTGVVDDPDDRDLGGAIRVGRGVGRARLQEDPARRLLPPREEDLAGGARSALRELEQPFYCCTIRPSIFGCTGEFAAIYADTASTSTSPTFTFVPFLKPVWPSPPV